MKVFSSGYGQPPSPTVCLWAYGEGQPLWQGSENQPSWLLQRGDVLYAANELPDEGQVTTFARQAGVWRREGSLVLPGGALCHLAANSEGSLLAACCWVGGDVFLLATNERGTPTAIVSHIRQQRPSGEASHAHCAAFNGELLYVVNLGLDALFCYHTAGGRLEEAACLSLPVGSGPRHLLLHPEKQLLYLITETSNQMLVVGCEGERMALLQSHSTLPDRFTGESFGASLCLSPDGRFLYGSNRGQDGIVCFKLREDGLLEAPSHFGCGGHWPRHIAMAEQGQLLAVANQKSGSVCFLPRNNEDGSLGPSVWRLPHSEVSFVAPEQSPPAT